MKSISTKHRSRHPEIMDSFDFHGEELEKTLRDLEKVNRWLGGNKITIDGIKRLVSGKIGRIHIADIGCGSGAMLRKIAKWGRQDNLNLKLTGIDANPHSVEIAKSWSKDFSEIDFKVQDVFEIEFRQSEYDIVSCCLVLHHFEEEKINALLKSLVCQSRLGIVVNDLHRSRLAYHLFRLFCAIFVRNKIAKNDGLVSILRGFKKKELKAFSKELGLKTKGLKWCWAFRYQWIVASVGSEQSQ